MSAVVKVRIRGSRFANSRGWVRIVNGGGNWNADVLFNSFRCGSTMRTLAKSRGIKVEQVEAVIRWYLNNPLERPSL